jgi:hypothetical protein
MENKKPTEQELSEWMEMVHFGSCCSDSVDQPNFSEKDKLAQVKKPSIE